MHRGVFRNRMTRYEMLGAEAMATIERDRRRLLQKIGVAFHHPEALQHFRDASYLAEVRRARRPQQQHQFDVRPLGFARCP